MDVVIAEAGLSTGSFDHFFESKEAPALAALERYCADRMERSAAGACAAETDPQHRPHGFLEYASHVAADVWKAECLPANLADRLLVRIEGSIVLARIPDDPSDLRRGIGKLRPTIG